MHTPTLGIDRRRTLAYPLPRRAPCAAGIDLLQTGRPGAHPKRFFCACRSMAGVMGALRSAAALCGKVNPVALRHPPIDLVGGGSQPTESTTMTDTAQVPSAPAAFLFNSSFVVRVLADEAGTHWFVARDVADALGYAKPADAVARHCKKAKSLNDMGSAFHGPQQDQSLTLDPQTKLIPEGDVYRLIVRSKLPSADAFETWLFEEVLPAIRKTGRYVAPQAQPEPAAYPRCTKEQLAKLTDAVQRSLYHWMFNPQATQHVYNRLRVDHHIKHIADLPAADFERALARVAEIASMNGAFASWIDEAKQAFLMEYVEAGAPWTLWLDRKWKAQMEAALPARPDWLDVQKKLGRCVG